MDRESPFPFHYGQEAEQYSYYRVPKILFTEPMFQKLSTDAKLLYGLFLDRMQLSIKNGWIDENGRVFIYFTVENIMAAFLCGNKKAGQLLAELDDKHGIGLITRVRQGLGKPDKIFVRKCIRSEMSKRHANNTDKNKTEWSNTEPIYPSEPIEDGAELYTQYRAYFEEQLYFEALLLDYPHEKDNLYEILELLVETVCSTRATIRISGEEKPAQIVKGRLLKLTDEHIRYVLACMKETTTRVRNIRQYLLAALYNAPATISSYYTALVNHDLYGEESR